MAIEALEAGKHVIIEKPAEATLAKIDDIIAAQQKAGTLVTVISQHRFDPASTKVAEYALPQETSATAGRDPAQLSDAHRYQYQNFLAALRGTEEIRVGLAENRQTISIIVGVYESARTGNPVSLV